MTGPERGEDGKPGVPAGARRAPPEAEPVLPGIPDPEPSDGQAPVPIPVDDKETDEGAEAGPSKVLELENRLDSRLEKGLDEKVELGTEEKLEGEIDQAIGQKVQQDLELQIDGEISRQLGPGPNVVDLSRNEQIPYAQVLLAEAAGPAEAQPAMPPGQSSEPSGKKKPARRAVLRNREPPGRKPSGNGAVNGRPAGLVNGRGLRNRRGLSNGIVNGEGIVNGRGAVNGLRNHRGFSNGIVNGEGVVNGRGAVNGLRNRRGFSNGNGMTNGNGTASDRRNGLTNGRQAMLGRRARVNGSLTDAEGASNGRGMVNGRGIVNGEGITNGRRLTMGEAPPGKRRSALKVIVAAVVAVMVLVIGLYALLISTEKGVHVDGVFSDWSGVTKYQDDIADEANPEINIVAYAMVLDGSSCSVYLRTEGKALGGRGNGVDSVYFFFDTDQDTATGYRIDSSGAELVLMVDGYDGRVSAAGLYRFPHDGARPANDWNSRLPAGSCRAAVAGTELEAQTTLADLGVGAGSNLNVLACTKDGSGGEDYAPVMSNEKVRLTAYWSRAGPDRTDPGASGVPLLRVELGSAGGNASVRSMTLHASGALSDGDLSSLSLQTAAGYDIPGATGTLGGGRATLTISPPLVVAPGSTTVLTVLGAFSLSAQTGKAVGLSLEGSRDISASTRAVTVESRGLSFTYIGAPSARITIDGAFLDWASYPDHPDPSGDVADRDIDATSFKAASEPGSLFFFLRVDGDMMGGAGIPERRLRPPVNQQGGGGGAVTLPVLVGEDAVFVFIDADNDSSTGYSGGGLPLGADYMANFTGQYGRLNHQGLQRFSGSGPSEWAWDAQGAVDAATDATQLEARLALPALGNPSGNVSMFYYTTNWRLDRDTGARVAFDLSAGSGGRAAGGEPAGYGTPEPSASGRDIQPLHAPEFQDVLLPAAGMVLVFFVVRRRGQRARR